MNKSINTILQCAQKLTSDSDTINECRLNADFKPLEINISDAGDYCTGTKVYKLKSHIMH